VWKLHSLSSCQYTHGVVQRLLGPHDTLPCVLILYVSYDQGKDKTFKWTAHPMLARLELISWGLQVSPLAPFFKAQQKLNLHIFKKIINVSSTASFIVFYFKTKLVLTCGILTDLVINNDLLIRGQFVQTMSFWFVTTIIQWILDTFIFDYAWHIWITTITNLN